MPVASISAAHDDAGQLHVTGVVDSHSAAPLVNEKASFTAKIVSLERTAGGGLAYDFQILIDDTTWREKEAADAAALAEAQAKASADAATAKAAADAQAAKVASDAADAKLASVVAAAVAKAVAPKE